MAHGVDSSPLGQKTVYISSYDPGLLFPIARSESRRALGLLNQLPFHGSDFWTGYELSWLNTKGKPQVAVAEFVIPCNSPNIIESKSFKLYLNSFNQSQFADFAAVHECLVRDLSAAAGAPIEVRLHNLQDSRMLIDLTFDGVCLDDLDIEVSCYHPDAMLLVADSTQKKTEKLYSHLLKSNCPVTGQPDWASIFIEYSGGSINHEQLLRYLISFREHQDFHEHCVERIFTDIMANCQPESLSVYARYTRRGGLDINPFRATSAGVAPGVGRLLRQ